MRLAPLLAFLALGCSHHTFIGPDDGGGDALVDGALPDGAFPDGGNAGDQSFQSGTRLKVRYTVSSDGAQQAIGFFDSERKENCSFTTASDGVKRCLPDAVIAYGPGTFYSDACVTPLIAIYGTCAPPAEARAAESTTPNCTPSRSDVYTFGSQFQGANVFIKSGTQCTSTVVATSWSYLSFYAPGALVSPTSFVDATEVVK